MPGMCPLVIVSLAFSFIYLLDHNVTHLNNTRNVSGRGLHPDGVTRDQLRPDGDRPEDDLDNDSDIEDDNDDDDHLEPVEEVLTDDDDGLAPRRPALARRDRLHLRHKEWKPVAYNCTVQRFCTLVLDNCTVQLYFTVRRFYTKVL